MGEDSTVLRGIEEHHIDIIPDDERYGKVWNQFTFWFGGNVNVFNLVLGGVLVSMGLGLYWALVAIVVGTCIGALLIALHATQGPKLGVPQMIQSRGQFGFYGSSFLFVAVFLLCFGFVAAQLVIQAQSLNLVAGISIPAWVIILIVPSVIIGIYGYKWTHRAAQVTAVIVGVALVVMFVQAVSYGHLPASETTWSAPSFPFFIAGSALLVIDMLTFGPFVSDYSRYLPKNVKGTRVFLSIYAGNVISTVGACAVGAYITALLPSLGSVAAVGKICGSWALVIMALSLVNSNTFCGYTGGLQILSFMNLFKRLNASAMTRIVAFLVTIVVGLVVAIVGYHSFVNNLTNFLYILLMIFIPWSAVNLADYFFVRHGVYNVPAFFVPNGIYGRFAWRGLLAYAIGLGAEIPFISQTYYTGALVKALGGADISWLVGFVVGGGLYMLLVKVSPLPARASAYAERAESGALSSAGGPEALAELDAATEETI